MRAVVQRVSSAQVVVEGHKIASIDKGLMVLIGFKDEDGVKEIEVIIEKILNLRIFEDQAQKMNLSVLNIEGEVLIVPNFTLYGDCRHGRRPSFTNAAAPETAKYFFDTFKKMICERFALAQFGEFQADMKVTLLNDGPVTLLLDSDKNF